MRKGIFFIPVLFLLVFLHSCGKKSEINKLEYSKYVSGFTQGMIRSSDPIYIRLEQNNMKLGENDTILPENVFKISPKIEGNVTLRDGNIIEFIPHQPFKNNQTYKVTLDLSKISDVPTKLSAFNFDVKIIPLVYSFKEGGLSVSEQDPNIFIYRASMNNSDYCSPEEIEKLVQAKVGNTKMEIDWHHSPYLHYFTINNIQRKEDLQTLEISFAKNVQNGNTYYVEIPGSQELSVLDVKINESNSRAFDIIMSDILDQSQDLHGLITINDSENLTFNISGNNIRVYPNSSLKLSGVVEIKIFAGVSNSNGEKLAEDVIRSIGFSSTNPAIEFIGKGTFTPSDGNALIPFSAVGLKEIQLRVVKVFSQNMNFYLQDNSYSYSSDYQLKRVGRLILDKKVSLELKGHVIDGDSWQDYTINLADHLQLEKGVLYRVELRFRKSYTTLPCANNGGDAIIQENWDGPSDYDYDDYYYDEYDDYYYGYPSDYRWEDRDDPCTNSYYYVSSRFPKKNVIVTNLGITAKSGPDMKYVVAINNLATTAAEDNCKVIFYNYQNEKIDSAMTNSEGIATAKLSMTPYVIVAAKGNDKAYLKLNYNTALELSNFDVSGAVVQKGIKGFIYGERGVWRPGNDIYLSFMLEDREKTIPVGHPILAELIDPNGNIVQTKKDTRAERGLYCFTFKTDEDAVTGYWRAVVRIGGVSFTKTIRIETVKPNRLNIETILPGNVLGVGIKDNDIEVKTRWMHGAKTSSLKSIVELKLSKGRTSFEGFRDYIFDDISRSFHTTNTTLFDGKTDANGNFTIDADKIEAEEAPGMLNAALTLRVFEPGGDFSVVASSFKYSPYTSYVGIKLPANDDNWYSTRKDIPVSGVILNADGTKAADTEVEIEVYSLRWRWWWDSESDNIGSYVNRSYNRAVMSKTVKTKDGVFNFDMSCNDWGRYYVIVRNKKSGHTTGTTFYASSYGQMEIPGSATMLSLSTDKKGYKAGEKIKVTFPSSTGSVALVSIETGKTIKDIFRVPTKAGTTTFEIDATADMCPNIYVSVSLIQPQRLRSNDNPIRLFGVVNVNVEDQKLVLNPTISIADELRPSTDFTVTVSEKDGKPMNYSIAIVDEGLLAITSFKTPNPFPAFYAREALGVRTYDFYDEIFGAFGGRLEKAFAIGGDETLESESVQKSDRFTPVVIFKGPFTLKKGDKNSHTFKMPEYVGEVRTMIVAEDDGKYGFADKQTKVVKPLMLNVTMPRLFTPGDVIEIPVTVFAMNNQVKNVTVDIKTDDKIEIVGSNKIDLSFNKEGEQIIFFKVKIKEDIGKSTIAFNGKSGNETAQFICDVDIRIPNPRVTKVDARELESGKSVTFDNSIEGLEPISLLEITSIPPLNLEQRLSYLITYPHGCGEQITSAVFPQLMLEYLIDLDNAQKKTVELHVKNVIARLRNYQHSSGGFCYWTSSSTPSEWVTCYITDFLIQAESQGYQVPTQMKNSALSYLSAVANAYRTSDRYTELEQSYRLYVLALAGKPNMAAMNRLKESNYRNPISRWQLAGAYALAKQQQTAKSIVENLPAEAELYRQLGRTYGSSLRDNAIILQSMTEMDMREEAYGLLQKMARRFSSNDWLSTQESAFGLCAIGRYVQKYFANGHGIEIQIDGKDVKTNKTVYQQQLEVKNKRSNVTIKNNMNGTLHVRTINSSIPLDVIHEKESSGLNMTVTYIRKENTGNSTDFIQGEDITAKITITNTGSVGRYDELALTFMFPSGFEFINERLISNINPFPGADHADIRDDRVYLYFSLEQGKSRTFNLKFNASYPGVYMMPAINCSAMYDNSITATLPGQMINIRREE